MQAREQKTNARERGSVKARLTPIPVRLQERSEYQLRRIGRKAVNDGRVDDAAGKSRNAELAQIALESPHHNWLKVVRLDRESAREPLRV